MRFLFALPSDTVSQFLTFLGTARHLRKLGHEAVWLAATPWQENKAKEFGEKFYRLSKDFPTPEFNEKEVELFKDPKTYDEAWRFIQCETIPYLTEPLRECMRDLKPDAVAASSTFYPPYIACELEKIPYVGISAQLTMLAPQLDFQWKRAIHATTEPRQRFMDEYGASRVKFNIWEALSPYGNVVFTTKGFIGNHGTVPPEVTLVGPASVDGERGDEPKGFDMSKYTDSRPLVLATLGTYFWQLRPDLFRIFAEAAASLDVTMLIGAGGFANSPDAKKMPPNVHVEEYVPQRQVLERASVFISHCGAGSTREAMMAGCPVLATPVDMEQFVQSYFIDKGGFGIERKLDGLTVENCRAALETMLRDAPRFRKNLEPLRDEYRRNNGSAKSAEMLIDAAKRGF